MNNISYINEKWLEELLVHPITKTRLNVQNLKKHNNIFDATVFLPNTFGWKEWKTGQKKFESWLLNGEYKCDHEKNFVKEKKEISKVYKNFNLSGTILDVGGSVGTLREFINPGSRFVSIDPHSNPLSTLSKEKIKVYKCLKEPLNFIRACAEFLPIKTESIDIVHMRSMLDHVQVPDLAIIEAFRVLKISGKLIIGIYLPKGKKDRLSTSFVLKEFIRHILSLFRFDKYKDYHTWHPSYQSLKKLIIDNGFRIDKEIWQSEWNDKVVYIQAKKK